jgi:hypothetical protein
VQENLLEKYPSAKLRVYAIWTNKYLLASRDRWDGGGLADPRVVHLWDERDLSGDWFVENLPSFRGGDWDSYLLFGPDAEWTTLPPQLLSSGSTVIGRRDELARSVRTLMFTP